MHTCVLPIWLFQQSYLILLLLLHFVFCLSFVMYKWEREVFAKFHLFVSLIWTSMILCWPHWTWIKLTFDGISPSCVWSLFHEVSIYHLKLLQVVYIKVRDIFSHAVVKSEDIPIEGFIPLTNGECYGDVFPFFCITDMLTIP